MATQFVRHARGFGGVLTRHHDPRTGGQKPLRNGAPYAPRAAGDDGSFAGKGKAVHYTGNPT